MKPFRFCVAYGPVVTDGRAEFLRCVSRFCALVGKCVREDDDRMIFDESVA